LGGIVIFERRYANHVPRIRRAFCIPASSRDLNHHRASGLPHHTHNNETGPRIDRPWISWHVSGFARHRLSPVGFWIGRGWASIRQDLEGLWPLRHGETEILRDASGMESETLVLTIILKVFKDLVDVDLGFRERGNPSIRYDPVNPSIIRC